MSPAVRRLAASLLILLAGCAGAPQSVPWPPVDRGTNARKGIASEEATARRVVSRLLGGVPLAVTGVPTDGQVLTYDSTTGTWRAESAAGGGETLAQTLALGATSGGTHLTMSSGDQIRASAALVTTATTTATHGATGAVVVASGASAQDASALGVTLTLQDGSLGSAVLYAANLYLADRAGTGSMGQITTPGVSGASQGLALNFVAGTGGPTDGQGGTITIQSGPGGGTAGAGGNVEILGGNPGGTGGSAGTVTVSAADSTGAAPGGYTTVSAGDSVSGQGGVVTWSAGNSQSGPGGNVQLSAGYNDNDDGATLYLYGAEVPTVAAEGRLHADVFRISGANSSNGNVAPLASFSIATTGLRQPYAALTSSRTLGQDESGLVVTNAGAGGTVTVFLRGANSGGALANGTTYTFVRVAAQALHVDPDSADNIEYSGGSMTSGEHLILASAGAKLTLVYDASNTAWIATEEFGTLTEETP